MSQTLFSSLLCVALALTSATAEIFPSAGPATRSASSGNSTRILALGEPRFSDSQVFNLYDQGGSPMGLLETRREKVGISVGYQSSQGASPGDTLSLDHTDLILPQLGFYQPGVFGVNLYFLRAAEAYHRIAADSVESQANLFGLDFAAGPASGLFRVGFSAHARMETLEYSANAKRILVSVPSLRFDLGSRFHPAMELGAFAGVSLQFDSLQNPVGHLERVADLTIPTFGLLADLGGTEDILVQGNVVLEFGTQRQLGEYRVLGDSGIQYPTLWTDYLTFQTQWLYPIQWEEFQFQPAARFAYRSENLQGYAGIKSNQDPFKKGPEIAGLKVERGITDFGLGGKVEYQDWISVLVEWETAGHAYKSDSTREEQYHRFAFGLENQLHLLPIHFPDGMSLVLRAGWSWRQEALSQTGDRDFHFDPFLPSPLPNRRGDLIQLKPSKPASWSAVTLGFHFGMMDEKISLDSYLSLPNHIEASGLNTFKTEGLDFSVTVTYRLL